MCDEIVVVYRSVVAHTFNQINRFLTTPANGPMTTAASGYEDGFAQGIARCVGHGCLLARVAGRFAIGAAGYDVLPIGCDFTG